MSKKILLIDDSPFFRGQLKLSLSKEYDVIEAGTGAEGLDLVKREKPDLVLLDIVMPDYSGFEICRILRESESNNLMPIIMITSQDAQEDVLIGLELGADDYVKKPFNERELLSRIKNIFRRIDRNRNANPLTGLNGNLEIQREITSRITKGYSFAVVYVDLDNFKAYNDVYGFTNGDRIIILSADILRDQVDLWGNNDDFVGHIGGDDFIIVSTPDRAVKICEEIIAEFDEKVLNFYNEEDRTRGYITTKNRKGEIDSFPLMSISLAIITNERRELSNSVEIGDIAAEVKKKLKTMSGSNYFIDRRTDDPGVHTMPPHTNGSGYANGGASEYVDAHSDTPASEYVDDEFGAPKAPASEYIDTAAEDQPVIASDSRATPDTPASEYIDATIDEPDEPASEYIDATIDEPDEPDEPASEYVDAPSDTPASEYIDTDFDGPDEPASETVDTMFGEAPGLPDTPASEYVDSEFGAPEVPASKGLDALFGAPANKYVDTPANPPAPRPAPPAHPPSPVRET